MRGQARKQEEESSSVGVRKRTGDPDSRPNSASEEKAAAEGVPWDLR